MSKFSFAPKLLLFCILLFAARLAAGETGSEPTRAEISAAERQKLLESVKPVKRSRLIEFLATAENEGIDQYIQFQISDFRIGFGKISPISGATPAIRLEKPRIAGKDVTLWLSGAYSIRAYQAYRLQFGYFDLPAPHDYDGHAYPEVPFQIDYRALDPMKPFLYLDSEYRKFPKEEFYGVGADSFEGNRSRYELESFTAALVGGYQFVRGITAQGKFEYINPTLHNPGDNQFPATDDLFNEAEAPGLTTQPTFLRYGGSFLAGYYGDPYKVAALLNASYSRFDDRDQGLFTFDRTQVDARAYLPLWCRQRLIAARFFASHDKPANGAVVPFYLMETLGGESTLRGFKNYRFRDENVMYMSAEYRWEGNAAVELAVFYDTGKVFPNGTDFNFKDLEEGYGFGIRFKNQRKTILRFDVGHSHEGTFGYFALTPSF